MGRGYIARFPDSRVGQNCLQLRIEAFNLTNHVNYTVNGTTLSAASTFGTITTDATPTSGSGAGGTTGNSTNAPARVLQFAVKYVF